jgi:hypothetical protein
MGSSLVGCGKKTERRQRGGESRHDRAGEGTAGGGSVGRKDQQVVAPSRDKRFTAGHEGTFSKTLLYEK